MLDKKTILQTLNLNDRILCMDGKKYLFIKVKRTKFNASRDGVTYSIPINFFDKLVEAAVKEAFDTSRLRENDLIYILNHKQEAIVFGFKYWINMDACIAVNPINNTKVKIPRSLIEGSVEELKNKHGVL